MQLWPIMSDDDDDDDGVEPQIEDVDEYEFEDGEGQPVCFSILPFQFDENDNEADFSRKNVFLHGFADKSLSVYKEVVAWKIRLDSEQPNIYVLSIQHKWIKLLKPRKCYGEFVRSILITVQMLHFVRKGGQRSCLNHLWDHLDEVFGKCNPKPAADDLMKHHTLIQLFAEKDHTLMKSKILQRLIKSGFERTKKALGLEAQFIVSGGWRFRKNGDNNYGNEDDSADDCDDGDGSIDDGDESSDDDDESSDDDDTDEFCTICDDGGTLLCCEGPCKRSFHPTEEDGRESKCETLGYTPAEVKSIGTYLCANCENKQHQCFRCGVLEPSHGPNAKVFQCNQASCGYFYHPKCIAQLLDPNATDGACELERRIMAGMSFLCPIHWCFKCGRMENKSQRALRFAVCRRCPRAYHRECLPRELSFGAMDKDGNPRAWKLSKKIFMYCLDHEIDKDTGAASRNHIKFPATPECTKTKELGNSKGRMTGKRRKNTDPSTKPTELSNRLCGAESEQDDNVGAKSTSPQIDVEPHCAAKLLKGDPQIEQSIIGVAASQNGAEAETMIGHEKQFDISSYVANTETEKRVTCLAGTPYDGPSTKGMSDCSVQDTPMDKDVELDKVACRITDDKYANGREKTQQDYNRKDFDAFRWSNRYGASTVEWQTEVARDIDGFPPHAFNPNALGPLFERHCSIQAHKFSESTGMCRVDAFALNKDSIPKSGDVGLQYMSQQGVNNVMFPVTMTTYNYSEAPAFVENEVHAGAGSFGSAGSVASYDTAEELGVDREVLEEAYAWQHRANRRLQRGRYYGHASDDSSSSTSARFL